MLADATRRQLQRLRFLLEEALDRSQDPTEIGRHSALVLLDGASEYAMGIALGHRGRSLPGSFPQKFNALQNAVDDWKPDTWASILQLHGARNQAQHHGTVADGSHMPSWAAQTQRFVDSLVLAAFGVELRSVLLAESVHTEDVRLQLVEGEKSLQQEDAEGAFNAVIGAFDTAREAWREQRVESVGELRLQYRGLGALVGGVETDPTNLSLMRFEDLLEVQPFAPDIGEYHWLLARTGEAKQDLVPTLLTAQRAFLFVLAWVLRWEAFTARYEARRYPPSAPAYEPPMTGADRPVIHDVSVETQHHIGNALDTPTLENVRYLVRVALADLPVEDRHVWSQQVSDVLEKAVEVESSYGVGATAVGADGIVRFHGVTPDVTAGEILSWVASALGEGDRRYQQRLGERQERNESLLAQRESLEEAVAAGGAGDLVTGVVSDERDDGSLWIGVRLRRDDDPILGQVLDGVAHTARSTREGVDYFDTTLWFVPECDPTEAAAAVELVAAEYRDEAQKRLLGRVAVENRRRALEDELRTAGLPDGG